MLDLDLDLEADLGIDIVMGIEGFAEAVALLFPDLAVATCRARARRR